VTIDDDQGQTMTDDQWMIGNDEDEILTGNWVECCEYKVDGNGQARRSKDEEAIRSDDSGRLVRGEGMK
jgi:hypothetical protein